MKKIVLIAACLASLAVPAHAESNSTLLQRQRALDGQCRGSIDPTGVATQEACDQRQVLTGELYARGYCWVGNFGYQQRWEKGPASRWTRRGELAVCHG